MIRQVESRTILNRVTQPDDWFGLRYSMNIYRGCAHGCIYCDSRSECYGIDDFDGSVIAKVNAPELLRRRLPSLRVKGTIGTGSMNDPYQPAEIELELIRSCLEIIAEHNYPVHIITKSHLVLRDADLLQLISKTYCAVTFTLTTTDETLAAKLEPRAPSPAHRLKTMEELSKMGILTGVTLMPVLPYITDKSEALEAVIKESAAAGASYIIPGFGVTLRDRQRCHFLEKVALHFSGLEEKYRRRYGHRYFCRSGNAQLLTSVFRRQCENLGISTSIPVYDPSDSHQQDLFEGWGS